MKKIIMAAGENSQTILLGILVIICIIIVLNMISFFYKKYKNSHFNKNDLTKYKEYVAKMSEEELEEWYDELYQMILLAFLMIDNVERMEKIKKLKHNINK